MKEKIIKIDFSSLSLYQVAQIVIDENYGAVDNGNIKILLPEKHITCDTCHKYHVKQKRNTFSCYDAHKFIVTEKKLAELCPFLIPHDMTLCLSHYPMKIHLAHLQKSSLYSLIHFYLSHIGQPQT
jgi:hypothetical protein